MEGKQDRKFNKAKFWFYFIIIAIILAIVIAFIVNRYGSSLKVISVTDFNTQFGKAIASSSDTTYFQDVKLDSYIGTVTYTFVENNVVVGTFQANVGREFAGLLGSSEAIGNWNLNGVLVKSLANWNESTAYSQVLNYAISGAQEAVAKFQYTPLPVASTSFFDRYIAPSIPLIVMIILYIALSMWLLRRNSNLMGAVGEDRNPAKKIKSDKTFKDIAGNKEAIEEIQEIVDYLKNPKKYQVAGARMPHGILLGGPPGTGKTLLAKATAGEANVPFYFISASNFVEMFVGLGAKRVRTVVEEARKNAPAIIFIDELDAIGRTRGAGLGGGHDEREQTLNQLLVEMDGMKENNGILFFAATNRADVLDPALTRPGRFDRTITVGLPDVKERQEILELHAQGKRLAPNIDLGKVAKRTPGFSGAQLENVINEASLLAVRASHDLITIEDIDEGIDRVMSGPAKKNRVISKEELTMVAYHEAGHAVVGLKVPGGNKVQKITIIPRGQAGGHNLMTPEEEKYNASRKELIAMITSFMGGRAAETIIYGEENISTGASDDIAKATKIARKMVTEWGMSALGPIQFEKDEGSPFLGRDYLKSAAFSSQIGHEIDVEVRKIMLEALENAQKVINENRELLELIKTALLEKETIVAEEIEYIAKNLSLPPKKEITPVDNKKFTLDELLNNSTTQQDSKNVDEKEESTENKNTANSQENN